jgi:hypothetical protein
MDYFVRKARQRKRARQREKDQVAKERAELISLLGGRCARKACGTDWNLCFDHVDGRDWKIRAVNQRTRVRRIRAEWERGVRIRLLCKRCNGKHKPSTKPLPPEECDPLVPPPPRREPDVPF